MGSGVQLGNLGGLEVKGNGEEGGVLMESKMQRGGRGRAGL